MAVEHVKSTPITELDATPRVAQTTGQGAAAELKTIEGVVTIPASADIDSTLQVVRVPFDAIIKEIIVDAAAFTTSGQFDIGVYYATDGTNALSEASLVAADAIDQDFFTITALDGGESNGLFAILVPGGGFRITNATVAQDANTVWGAVDVHLPLWEALGLSANPGGNADICLTLTEAIGAAAAIVSLQVKFTD
jgi:hypothetical protein